MHLHALILLQRRFSLNRKVLKQTLGNQVLRKVEEFAESAAAGAGNMLRYASVRTATGRRAHQLKQRIRTNLD